MASGRRAVKKEEEKTEAVVSIQQGPKETGKRKRGKKKKSELTEEEKLKKREQELARLIALNIARNQLLHGEEMSAKTVAAPAAENQKGGGGETASLPKGSPHLSSCPWLSPPHSPFCFELSYFIGYLIFF